MGSLTDEAKKVIEQTFDEISEPGLEWDFALVSGPNGAPAYLLYVAIPNPAQLGGQIASGNMVPHKSMGQEVDWKDVVRQVHEAILTERSRVLAEGQKSPSGLILK